MRTIGAELPLADDPPAKGSHIIDRMAAFLTFKGMKSAGSKGLAANWHKQFGQDKMEAALRIAEVAPNVGNYAAYIASVLQAKDAPPQPERAETPLATKVFSPPLWLQTTAITHERNRMVKDWQEWNAAKLATLCQVAKWNAQRKAEGKAWLQAQYLLRGEPVTQVELTDEEWQDCIDRARSVGSEGLL